MAVPYSDLQALNQPSPYVELFRLDCTALGGSIYNFTSQPARPWALEPHNLLAYSAGPYSNWSTNPSNVALQSENLSVSPWVRGPNLTANGSSGTLEGITAWSFTSTSPSNSYIRQSIALTVGASYTVSYLCDTDQGNSWVTFNGVGTQSSNLNKTLVSTGVWRWSLNFTVPTGTTTCTVHAGRIDAPAGFTFRTTAMCVRGGSNATGYIPSGATIGLGGTDVGAGAAINGATTRRITPTINGGGFFRSSSTIASGQSFVISHYINQVTGTGNFIGGTDTGGRTNMTFNPSTGVFTSGPANKGAIAVDGGWWIWGEYSGTASTVAVLNYIGTTTTTFDVVSWVNLGSRPMAYVPTTTVAITGPGDGFGSSSVVFNGVTYAPLPIATSGWDYTQTGSQPKPTITVSNVNKTFLAAVVNLGDLVGATLYRYRTFGKYLDGEATADPTKYIGPDQYVIEQKTAHNRNFITWQCSSIIDRMGIKLPRRQVLKDKGFPGVGRTRIR